MLTSKGDSQAADPIATHQGERDERRDDHSHHYDLKRTAVEIAALYKGRWQIELLFRWIKQASQPSQIHGQERQRHSPAESSLR